MFLLFQARSIPFSLLILVLFGSLLLFPVLAFGMFLISLLGVYGNFSMALQMSQEI